MNARPPAAPAPEIPGLVFVEPLGSGGYADVYLYEQQMPRMPVAVKVLKRDGLTDAIRRQFTDEANTMAHLGDHPYIVQIFRSEVAADGRPYMVMKYYPPPNLALRARSERFTVEEVLRTGIQVASAVETAHRAGITHRDIKPANILVSQYGAPGLTDFGIAGRGARDDDDLDDVGVSVPWAAPEVIYGQSNGSVAADVYSLSATLWHLLVGRSPFEVPGGDNSSYALMPRIRQSAPPGTGRADVPQTLERLLQQGMAKLPEARPATALELARALQQVEQEQRFARTEILVLDESGNATLESHRGAVDDDEDERTRVKAPQSVAAQRVAPPRPTSGPRPAPPADGVTPHPTTYATPGPRPAPAPEADDATVRRSPAAVPQAMPVPVDAQPTADLAGWRRPAVALTAVVTLVALAVVVLVVLLLGGRGDAADPGTPATGRATITPSDQPVVDIPSTPTVSVRPIAGGVTFSWNYVAPERGRDTFRIQVGPTPDDARRAAPRTVQDTSTTVRTTTGRALCVVVSVVRSGVTSNPSEAACGRAG
ncbi:serine/threonine-protein kinase [Angustibacter sp. Root456]|uniref:serine/threonine-protein kinase n=1 Tax=Angustibacter sp. Root456 TaxID=1736539 RepID=UPI0006F9793F|nr:serine/threonine-protein kinase [Angustibacter sp. Root456]KQX61894.1 serine/threonine protein kinase [Angustibacter sp. Root456]